MIKRIYDEETEQFYEIKRNIFGGLKLKKHPKNLPVTTFLWFNNKRGLRDGTTRNKEGKL